MKVLSFNFKGFDRLGVLQDDGETVLAVDRANKSMPQTLMDVIKRGPYARHQLTQAQDSLERFHFDEIELIPPIIPWATFSVTASSSDQAEAKKLSEAIYPMVSLRTPRNNVPHREVIDIPLKTKTLSCQGKLVVVMGRGGRYITLEHASRHIFGYSIYNEGHVKEFENHNSQFGMGRMFDTSAAFGPFVVTEDEFGDPYQQTLETRIDGNVVQSTSLSRMRHTIEQVIVYISSAVTMFPGDIICIGIPAGEEAMPQLAPDRLMNVDEQVEVSISGIGTLLNPIKDEPSTPKTVGCC